MKDLLPLMLPAAIVAVALWISAKAIAATGEIAFEIRRLADAIRSANDFRSPNV